MEIIIARSLKATIKTHTDLQPCHLNQNPSFVGCEPQAVQKIVTAQLCPCVCSETPHSQQMSPGQHSNLLISVNAASNLALFWPAPIEAQPRRALVLSNSDTSHAVPSGWQTQTTAMERSWHHSQGRLWVLASANQRTKWRVWGGKCSPQCSSGVCVGRCHWDNRSGWCLNLKQSLCVIKAYKDC